MRASINTTITATKKILIFADANAASLFICILFPLAPLVRAGNIELSVTTESDLHTAPNPLETIAAVFRWRPDIVILSRFASIHQQSIIETAHKIGIPIIAHLDDNLMEVGIDLGEAKFKRYNEPVRKSNLIAGLRAADLVYTGNGYLAERITFHADTKRIFVGSINSSGFVCADHDEASRVVGYMATGGHAGDLELIAKDIIWLMQTHPKIRFELFGSIAAPPWALRFGERFRKIPPTLSYVSFIKVLSGVRWRIGLAPLIRNPFNISKSNCKWIEYTCTGIPTVASQTPNYEECCANGRGSLNNSSEDWRESMDRLVSEPGLTLEQIRHAQEWLGRKQSPALHTMQMVTLLKQAGGDAGAWGAAASATMDNLLAKPVSEQKALYGFDR